MDFFLLHRTGSMVSSEVTAEFRCDCRLSGMPGIIKKAILFCNVCIDIVVVFFASSDMTMYFNRAELMDDVAFHRCVRYKVWEKNKQVSFVPPDGKFTLLSFRSKGQIQLPLLVEPKVTIGNGGGEIRVRITPRDVSPKPCQDVYLEIRFPRIISSATLSADAGRCQFDDSTKVLQFNSILFF